MSFLKVTFCSPVCLAQYTVCRELENKQKPSFYFALSAIYAGLGQDDSSAIQTTECQTTGGSSCDRWALWRSDPPTFESLAMSDLVGISSLSYNQDCL